MKISKQDDIYEEEEEAVENTSSVGKSPEGSEEPSDDYDDDGGDDDEDDDDDYDDEDDDDDDDEESSEIKTIFGIDRKFILIGIVLLLIVVVGTTIVRGCGSDSTDETEVSESTYTSDEYIPDATEYVPDEAPQEEAPPQNYTVKDVVISDEMAQQLQAYGYTGDEIELAEEFGITPEAMIASAKVRQTNSAKETIKQLSSTGSIAYQNLANMTYLGQDFAQPPVDQTKVDPEKAKVGETEETINCTYEKCPTYGVQLYLKCKVLNNIYIWYAISPQRWVQLPQNGSITLRVKYTRYGDNTYVTDIQEVTDPDARVVQSDIVESTEPFADSDSGGIVQ